MKTHTPQFDLPGTSDAFNLAVESAQDGARIIAERKQSQEDRKAADARQIDLVTEQPQLKLNR